MFGNIFNRKLKQVFRYINGTTFYEYGNDTNFSKFDNDYSGLIEYALDNPAFMLALKAKCDLFSLVKINSYTKDNVLDKEDFFHTVVGNANYFQTWEQLLWEYCFWKSIGTAYLYTPDNNEITKGTQFIMLRPQDIVFSSETRKALGKIVLTKKSYDDLMKNQVKYRQNDDSINNALPIALKLIHPFFSTTNGITGNWYEGYSMINSLTPIMDNVMELLKTQNVNLRYSGKFMGTKETGKIDLNDLNNGTALETKDIEEKVSSSKDFHALKEPFSIKRFVDSIANLKLDDQLITQYFLIGKMLGMPKDYLEASLKGSTYDNKSQAMLQVVSQVLQPDIDQFTSFVEGKYGVNKLKGSWSHLPFMSDSEKTRQELIKEKLLNIKLAQENGAKYTEAELQQQVREAINS